ncbi:hypothetical protein ACQVTS_18675 [Bacillus mycoides]
MKKVVVSFVCLLGLVVMFGKTDLSNKKTTNVEVQRMMASEPGGS